MFGSRGLSGSANVSKVNNANFRKIILAAGIVLLTGLSGQLSAGVPAAMEKDMDELNSALYEALKVIDTKSESEALAQLAVMRPKLEAKTKAYAAKWAGTELSEEDEMELGRKLLEKQSFRDMYALMESPSLLSKIENSPALKREYDALMNIMDEEADEEASASSAIAGSTVLSFSVSGAVPYAGSYSVSANDEQAFALLGMDNPLEVHVSSTLNGGEFELLILSEEAITGKQKWSMESQIIIQSWDKEQNEAIQMSSYYNEGSVTFDVIEGAGGKVSGSFEGKFFDDTQASEQPVTVSGKFSVIMQADGKE